MTEKSEECSFNQPVENRDVRGTVVLLKNSTTVWITEHHKRIESSSIQSLCSLAQQDMQPDGEHCKMVLSSVDGSETHTVKRAPHSPFTDCTTGTVIQLGGNLS
ncbi:hypothetical protein TNCV_2386601 [Trichonephila clavipes]|nr:hypothetical protein TNCV_2386601 [Trichonephila clavipes]